MERPQRPPPNPYYGLPLEEVTVAMHRRASQLQARTPRTPEERLALAEDTAYLLLTAAAALDPGKLIPHQPEDELTRERTTLAGVFGEWHRGLAIATRYRVLVRACNAAIGGGADHWRRAARVGERDLTDVAVESDGGLQRVLEMLDAEWRARRR